MSQKIKNFATTSWPFLIFIAISIVMLPTSFLYQVSPIGDINTMLAMGRSLAHGVIPFIDIFEQRGPYMYVLHIVAALPGNSLHWIYLIELVNFYILYRILIKIADLSDKIKPNTSKYWATGMLSLYLFSPTIWYGASPEEFCLVPIAYATYVILKSTSQKPLSHFSVSNKDVFALGLGLGWIIFVKYSVIGAIVGFFFSYGLYLLFTKQIKKFVQTIGVAISGVLAMSTPVIIGYAMTGHLLSAAKEYFIENTGASAYTIPQALAKIIQLLGINALSSVALITILALPFIMGMIKMKQISKSGLFIMSMTFIAQTLLSTLILRYLPTYFTGTIFIMLAISTWILPDLYLTISQSKLTVKLFISSVIVVPAIFFGSIINGQLWHFDDLFYHYHVTDLKSDASYHQGQIIKNNGGGSIEVYSDVARSIYQWADSYPTLKYFDQTTIPYKSQPQAGDSQFNYIKNKDADWVQTPTVGFHKKDLSISEIPEFLQYQASHQKKYKNSSKSISATIDAPIERAHLNQNEYYPTIYGSYKNKTFIMSYVPKPLLKNYVLVDASQVFEKSQSFQFGNKRLNGISVDLLFTTKEIAKKHNLKAIPFKLIKD